MGHALSRSLPRLLLCRCVSRLGMAGNPSIVLGMCRDYWDGSAISNLPAALRKTILGMHQQWSLVRVKSNSCKRDG